jgi:hypothetical protein
MKPMQLGSLNPHLPPVEKDLASRIEAIFGRYPSLHGFAVQNGATLKKDFPGVALDGALVVSNVGVYPSLGEGEHDRLCNEIAVALHDFISTRPEGAEMLLRGRTFARALH